MSDMELLEEARGGTELVGLDDFKPSGTVRYAMLCHEPSFATKLRHSSNPVYAAGQRYEARVHARLRELFPAMYASGVWFAFSGAGGMRYCQADGLLFDFRRGRITIVEVKVHHCLRAYQQLVQLYQPVVRSCFGENWHISVLEICRWYDPAIALPVPVRLHADIGRCREDEFSVHIMGV